MEERKVPKIADLFDLEHTIAAPLFEGKVYPWEVLDGIKDFILQLGPTLDPEKFDNPSEGVWIAKSATVFPSAYIASPCIIDEGAQVRHGAFIRGSAIVGKNDVVGNSVELKNVIIFDDCQVPHYNYVGDSVLGWHAHMGAGAITSNIKADRTNIVVKAPDEEIATGRRKIGGMLGDYVDVGCNAVLNPGAIIGRHTNVYPTSCVRGVIPANSIYKSADDIAAKR
ncbi:MAG: UDP-N-acetylglucosamine pyrophosphorylase [Firmicutes bacterium]|nr:UDP-N-acetylglucosamine pyrophosphorylase [Bacillota bacterium]